ncbi:hypothetical protein HOLleu_44163 [Holothuria leucospilota]|uniref:Uncharacterized protein n=1 Tax=Holothuria leucospilota TaxID=206669 RepID=A0A9Q0YCS2_HOLLE|nr:hypothetical protein HOLleu_44163 [Holothuria leucospilota]
MVHNRYYAVLGVWAMDEDGLYRFLEKRNVPASLIDKMKEDKKVNDEEDDIEEVQTTDKSDVQQDVQSADETPLPDPFTFCESEVEVENIPTAVWDVAFTEEASDGEISSSSSRITAFRSEYNMYDSRLESEILDDTVPYEVDNASKSEEKVIMRLH